MTVMLMRPGERRFATERADKWAAHIEPQCYVEYELVLDYSDPKHMWDRATKVIRPMGSVEYVDNWYAAIDRGWVKVLELVDSSDSSVTCPTCGVRGPMKIRSVTGPMEVDRGTEHLMESFYNTCGHSVPWTM